jgi:SNF2 family DNA or RNA helicase
MRQWEKEIDRHVAPGHKLSVHLYHGSGKNVDYASLRNFDVVLTTFGCLTSEYKRLKSSKESMLREQEQRGSIQRKPKDRLALLGPQSMWHRVIIDEAHNIKNRKAQSSLACAELMAHHRLCLTGTPMMNSVEELYPLLRFLRVKHYENWPNFNKEIAKVGTPRFRHKKCMLTSYSP